MSPDLARIYNVDKFEYINSYRKFVDEQLEAVRQKHFKKYVLGQ